MGEDVTITPEQQMSSTDSNNTSHGGKGRGKRNNRRGFNQPGLTSTFPKTSRFEGRCAELRGHVYDCSNPRQAADDYARTTKEIAEYTGTKYSAEVTITIETLQKPILPLPADLPDNASATEKQI